MKSKDREKGTFGHQQSVSLEFNESVNCLMFNFKLVFMKNAFGRFSVWKVWLYILCISAGTYGERNILSYFKKVFN